MPAVRRSARPAGVAGVSPFAVKPAPVVVLAGTDQALADVALDRIRSHLSASDAEVEVHRLGAATAAAGDLLEAVAPSLFGGTRLVIASGIEAAAGPLAADLTTVAGDWPRYADLGLTLVARHAGGAGGKAVMAALTGVAGAVTVDCAPPGNDRARAELVHVCLRSHGVAADDDIVTALVQALGGDTAELLAVTRQLAQTAEGPRIADDEARALIGGRRETRGFDVADAVLAGDAATGLALLRHAMLQKVEPVLVIGAIGAELRTMARVAAAGRGSPAGLAKDLGLPSWQVERAQRSLRRWTPDGLATALIALGDADAAVKGEVGALPAGYALERAVLAVAAARRG